MSLTLADLKQRDLMATALRINRQDITPLVEGCRNVVEYRRPAAKWNHVFVEYLRVLRCLTEAQEKASALGMDECPLAAPLAPLGIWRDDYQWTALLERLGALPPPVKRAA